MLIVEVIPCKTFRELNLHREGDIKEWKKKQ